MATKSLVEGNSINRAAAFAAGLALQHVLRRRRPLKVRAWGIGSTISTTACKRLRAIAAQIGPVASC